MDSLDTRCNRLSVSPDFSFSTRNSVDTIRRSHAYSCDSPGIRVQAGFYLPSLKVQNRHNEATVLTSSEERQLEDNGTAHQPPSQGSLVTIFSMWTAMVGTSLLAIPWAISQAGFALGIGLIFLVGLLAFYPICLIVQSAKEVSSRLGAPVHTFFEVCNHVLGPSVAWFGLIVSLLNLLGDLICYWIMLSTMLYQIGCFFMALKIDPSLTDGSANTTETSLVAPPAFGYWNEMVTVPLYLILILLPFTCLKNPMFFAKFSSLGIVSVISLVIFVIVKSFTWGVNVRVPSGFANFNVNFPALTGTLSIGFLVHNVVIAMTVYHEHPKKKLRDTGIAFLLTAITYALLAGYYFSYPGQKDKISDNFLKDFANDDVLALVARLLLFLQMLTTFPLLAFLFRVQLFTAWMNQIDVGMHLIVFLNSVLVGTCLIFACFYPRVGHILRFMGAVCGMVYIGSLPFIVQITLAWKAGKPVILKTGIFLFFLLLGAANFVAQILLPNN